MAGEVGGIAERLSGVAAFDDGRQVENGQRGHCGQVGRGARNSTHRS